MKKKITLKSILTNLDAIITGTTLTICVILVNANVIMRYFFNNPIHWSEEVVTSLFVWTVFIGSSYAYRKHSHLGVDILVNLMPKKMKSVVKAVMSVVEFLVLVMLTVVSSQYVYHRKDQNRHDRHAARAQVVDGHRGADRLRPLRDLFGLLHGEGRARLSQE